MISKITLTLLVVETLLLHTLFVLLETIGSISKLLLSREAVKGRYPRMLSFISFLDWRAIPWEGLKNKRLHLSARCIGTRITHEKLGEV